MYKFTVTYTWSASFTERAVTVKLSVSITDFVHCFSVQVVHEDGSPSEVGELGNIVVK